MTSDLDRNSCEVLSTQGTKSILYFRRWTPGSYILKWLHKTPSFHVHDSWKLPINSNTKKTTKVKPTGYYKKHNGALRHRQRTSKPKKKKRNRKNSQEERNTLFQKLKRKKTAYEFIHNHKPPQSFMSTNK